MNLRERIHRRLFAAECHAHDMLELELKRTEDREVELAGKLTATQQHLDAAQKNVERFRPKPARFDRYRAMDDEQLAEVLAGAGELPAVKAILQMIDEKFQQANDAASDPELDDRTTKFNLGGADWIVKLKAELQAALEQERAKEVRR